MLAQWLFIIEGRPLVGSKPSAHLIFGKGKEKNVADMLHAVIKLIMLPNAIESKNSFCIIYGLQRYMHFKKTRKYYIAQSKPHSVAIKEIN